MKIKEWIFDVILIAGLLTSLAFRNNPLALFFGGLCLIFVGVQGLINKKARVGDDPTIFFGKKAKIISWTFTVVGIALIIAFLLIKK